MVLSLNIIKNKKNIYFEKIKNCGSKTFIIVIKSRDN